MTTFPSPLHAHVPDCRFACPRIVSPVPGANSVLVVRCAANADLKEACGYGDLCPHKGPYTDMEDALEERDSCMLRQVLRLP